MSNGKKTTRASEIVEACAAVGRGVTNSLGGDVRYIQYTGNNCYYYGAGSQSGKSGPNTYRFDPVSCSKETDNVCRWVEDNQRGWHIACLDNRTGRTGGQKKDSTVHRNPCRNKGRCGYGGTCTEQGFGYKCTCKKGDRGGGFIPG